MTYYVNHKGGEILSALMRDIPQLNIKDLLTIKHESNQDDVTITIHDYRSSYYDMMNKKFTYKGDIIDGRRDGIGRCYNLENRLIYSGFWHNDMLNGWAIKYNQYAQKIYVGKWLNGLPHGWGVEYAADGSILYSGRWLNGLPR